MKNKKRLCINSGSFKLIAFFFIISIVASNALLINNSKAATVNATLFFDTSSVSSVVGGSNFNLIARVNPGSNTVNGINAVQLDITFDPSVVHLATFTAASPFSVLGNPDITAVNASGTLSVALFIAASQITSTSDVATLAFTPFGAGSSSPISYASTANAAINDGNGTNVVGTRTGATVTVTIPDVTPPIISSTAPASNSYIKNITSNSQVSYTLSESVQSGTISFDRIGGTADSTTHTCTLIGTALNAGVHNNLNLSDTTNSCTTVQTLNSGTIYSVTFNATDSAGNPAIPVTNTGITFDNTSPIISLTSPASNSYIKSITSASSVSYSLDETIQSGTIAFSRIGGVNDSITHTCNLTGTALNVGLHNNLDLSNTVNSCTVAQSLTNGTVYSVTFNATDLAGNLAASVSNSNITFDNVSPIIAQVTPVALISSFNTPNYTFSSTEVGTITYGGGCSSVTTTAIIGNNTIAFTPLSRRASYACTFKVTDVAGNQSALLTATTFVITDRGDLNNDRSVNISDLSILSSNWGKTSGYGASDVNGDSIVNISDLSIIAADYGHTF